MFRIRLPIGGHVEDPAGLQLAQHQFDKRRLHDAALVVARLVPRIGEEQLHHVQRAVRDHVFQHFNRIVMPNTPSLVGKGMSGLYAPEQVSQQDRDYTGDLMASVGKVCWVDDENGINGVIAAAGSAPAYFFLFMEAMQKEAERMGFDSQTARDLVQQAASGAAALVEANPDTPLGTLREQVTSKGGTTAEALRVFNERQLPETVAQAMQAAVSRAQEMEKLF